MAVANSGILMKPLLFLKRPQIGAALLATILATVMLPTGARSSDIAVPRPIHTPRFEIKEPQGMHPRNGLPWDARFAHDLKSAGNAWQLGFPSLRQQGKTLMIRHFNTPLLYSKMEYGHLEVRDCIFTEPTYTPILARCGDSDGRGHPNMRIVERCRFEGWCGPHLINFDRVGEPRKGSGCSHAEVRDITCLELCSNGTRHDVKGISIDCTEAVESSRVVIERVWLRSPRELRGEGCMMPSTIQGPFSDAVYLIAIQNADEAVVQDCLLEGSSGCGIIVTARQKVTLRNIEMYDVGQAAPYEGVWRGRFAVEPILINCLEDTEVLVENITLEGHPYEPVIRRKQRPQPRP